MRKIEGPLNESSFGSTPATFLSRLRPKKKLVANRLKMGYRGKRKEKNDQLLTIEIFRT